MRWIFAVALALLLASPSLAAAPTVIQVDPADAETGVATNKRIHVTFDQALDPATVTSANCQITLAGVPITTGLVSWQAGSNSVRIRPLGQLKASTAYGIKITTGVTNVGAEALASEFTSTFTTAATYAAGTTIFENVDITPNVDLH